ncbi:MAG: carbohydrate ABC transporter permease [Defluviitaleaceae bacterium]|nr:carbohydrate ABC transporter permease [Defluviitaleaceae bacterium]
MVATKSRVGRRRMPPLLKARKPNRSIRGDIGIFIFIALVAAFFLLPLIFAVSNAFKPFDELFLFPPRFFVINPTMQNFRDLFVLIDASWVPFSRYVVNTVFLTIAGTIGHVFLASLAAYALEKHRFPGRQFLFAMVIFSLMFSGHVTGIPNFIIMTWLGWIDSLASLIVPAWGAALGLFLMKQFMTQVPDALLESSRIDGANEFWIYSRIVMPLVKPAWVTLIIISFQGLWNATGSTFIYSEENKPLPFALGQIVAGGIGRAGAAAAVGVIMMIVPLAVFIISQSKVMETMASSGIKE